MGARRRWTPCGCSSATTSSRTCSRYASASFSMISPSMSATTRQHRRHVEEGGGLRGVGPRACAQAHEGRVFLNLNRAVLADAHKPEAPLVPKERIRLAGGVSGPTAGSLL